MQRLICRSTSGNRFIRGVPSATCQQDLGIPGAFPPIADRVEKFASIPKGRAYLTMVVNAGLIGSISIAGTPYVGAMPGLGTTLDDQSISAVLNYVALALGSTADPDFKPFTADEVATHKAKHSPASGNTTHQMRTELLQETPLLR